jgi:hypothetical protein
LKVFQNLLEELPADYLGQQRSVSIATGSFKLDLDCQNAEDESTHCSLKSKTANPTLQVSTVPSAPQLPATASCEDNAKAYQSWQLEDWHRQYRSAPGDITTPPAMDSGPSFTLRNMANGGVFKCAPSGNKTEANIFDGACTQAAGAGALATTTAAFQFDPALDLLSVTQRWECGNT